MKNLDREEFQLVYDALKNYSVYMDSDQKKLSEQNPEHINSSSK